MKVLSDKDLGTVCISFDALADPTASNRVRAELEMMQKKLDFSMCVTSRGDIQIPNVEFMTFIALDDALKDEGIEIEFDAEGSSKATTGEQNRLDRQIDALIKAIDVLHRADLIVYINGATLYIERRAKDDGISIASFMGIQINKVQSLRVGRHRNLETGKLAVRLVCVYRNGVTDTIEIPSEDLLRITSDHEILFDIDEGDEPWSLNKEVES